MLNKFISLLVRLKNNYLFVYYRLQRNKSFKFRYKKSNIIKLSRIQKKEANNFWKKHTNLYKDNYCSFYSSKNGKFDVRYIPDDLYYTKIDWYFNNTQMSYGIDNKAYYDKVFPNVLKPITYVRCINGFFYDNQYNIITIHDAINLLEANITYIFKPSIGSCGGKNIIFINNNSYDEIYKIFISNSNFIVQEVIKQHSSISIIHPSSVNTIRVVSLLINNEVYILSSVLRMGVNGNRVDNASAGGIVCGIDQSGKLKEYAFTSSGDKYPIHPQGFKFNGYPIPSFDKIIEIVKREAKYFAYFRLIHWDFAINENAEPVLIEFNLQYGQLDFHQYTNGPLFGDLTVQVLEEVFNK